MRTKPPFILGLVLAAVASASTWFYMNGILRAQQVADAAAYGRPRGNLSDLYPRWLGARELLRHGRNPYSAEITREIQQGYYGRPLDPSRPNDPKDQQGFAYPVYVVFLLAPTIDLPFNLVQAGFRWLLVALAVVTVWLWLYVLRWRVSFGTVLIFVVLLIGWLPMVQGIKLQQLTLLVTGFLAAAGACLSAGWLGWAGALLALASIKPQLTWPLVLWLLFWATRDWHSRKRFVVSFAIVMFLLVLGGQLILPGWLRMFVEGLRQYHQYLQNESIPSELFGLLAGRIVIAVCIVASAACLWKLRQEPASSAAFGRAFALVLALTIAIAPMSALYNQVLLAPAILALLHSDSSGERILPAVRRARMVGYFMVVWPWIATLFLILFYPWITPERRQHLWPMPLYTALLVPIFVFGLALLNTWPGEPARLPDRVTAE